MLKLIRIIVEYAIILILIFGSYACSNIPLTVVQEHRIISDVHEKREKRNDLEFFSSYSKKFGIDFDGTENKRLIMSIDKWLGTRYRWGGCSKSGVDCSCLVKMIYYETYGVVMNRSSREIVYENLIPITNGEFNEGDILSFDIDGDGISHIGIYLKNNKFVHASKASGVTLSDLEDHYYKSRFVSAGRIKKFINRNHSVSSPFRQPKIKLGHLIINDSDG